MKLLVWFVHSSIGCWQQLQYSLSYISLINTSFFQYIALTIQRSLSCRQRRVRMVHCRKSLLLLILPSCWSEKKDTSMEQYHKNCKVDRWWFFFSVCVYNQAGEWVLISAGGIVEKHWGPNCASRLYFFFLRWGVVCHCSSAPLLLFLLPLSSHLINCCTCVLLFTSWQTVKVQLLVSCFSAEKSVTRVYL